MSKRVFIIDILIIILISISITYVIPVEAVQILRTGTFHGNEVRAISGEIWFGLYPENDGYEIKRSTITVELVYDGCVDKKDEKTGKKVTVDQPKEPLFLFKGLPNISEGKIRTVFSGKKFMFPGEHWTQKFIDEESFGIQAFGSAVEDLRRSEFYSTIHNYKLKMSKRPWRRTQTIASFDIIDLGGQPEFHWIGDLDGDGEPDIFMNLTDTYAGDYWTLFLSSFALKGEYVHKVAVFIQGSC